MAQPVNPCVLGASPPQLPHPEEPDAAVSRTYLLPSELARQLQVSPKTVSRWLREGKVAHTRTIGGHARISLEEADRLVELMFELGSGRPEAEGSGL